jgi:hypothetical protein
MHCTIPVYSYNGCIRFYLGFLQNFVLASCITEWRISFTLPFSTTNSSSYLTHSSPTRRSSNDQRLLARLTLSNPIFLPPAYSLDLIYFRRERGWWISCNYPTVLKHKNRNRKSTTCAICWLQSVLHEEKRREQENHVGRRPTVWYSCSRCFSSCNTGFSQQIAQVVFFLFLFFSFKTVG